MTPLPIRTFRANLRTWLDRAARGEPVTILYRGAPLAEVHPVGTGERLKARRQSKPAYAFEGAYAAFIAALPEWGVDLNAGIELWNKQDDPLHVSAFVYTDSHPDDTGKQVAVGEWVVNVGPRRFTQSTRLYDGMDRADVDALVADLLAAIDLAVAHSIREAVR